MWQTDKTREVYEENLNLRDRVHQSEAELIHLRSLTDDFNNLSARASHSLSTVAPHTQAAFYTNLYLKSLFLDLAFLLLLYR